MGGGAGKCLEPEYSDDSFSDESRVRKFEEFRQYGRHAQSVSDLSTVAQEKRRRREQSEGSKTYCSWVVPVEYESSGENLEFNEDSCSETLSPACVAIDEFLMKFNDNKGCYALKIPEKYQFSSDQELFLKFQIDLEKVGARYDDEPSYTHTLCEQKYETKILNAETLKLTDSGVTVSVSRGQYHSPPAIRIHVVLKRKTQTGDSISTKLSGEYLGDITYRQDQVCVDWYLKEKFDKFLEAHRNWAIQARREKEPDPDKPEPQLSEIRLNDNELKLIFPEVSKTRRLLQEHNRTSKAALSA